MSHNYSIEQSEAKRPSRFPSTLIPAALTALWICTIGLLSLAESAEEFGTITDNGMWTWYAEPKAVYHKGIHSKTYVGYITLDGDIDIAAYDHEAKKWSTATLQKNVKVDDHSHPVILVRNDGHLVVIRMGHDGHSNMWISTNPEDISGWGSTIAPAKGGRCYPNVMQLSGENNRIYLLGRAGGWWSDALCITSDDGGKTWSDQTSWTTGMVGGYTKYYSNGKDEIHFIAEEKLRTGSDGHILYAYYKAGAFYRTNGTKIKDVSAGPLKANEMEIVVNQNEDNLGKTTWDLTLDRDGKPVALYVKGTQDCNGYEMAGQQYWYARYDGSKWQKNMIVGGFACLGSRGHSGGVTFNHANPSIIYLSRNHLKAGMENVAKNYTYHEIERWNTTDGGKSWTSQALTKDSKLMNYRPCVPRGYTGGEIGLVWLYGRYGSATGCTKSSCPEGVTVKYWSPGTTATQQSFTPVKQVRTVKTSRLHIDLNEHVTSDIKERFTIQGKALRSHADMDRVTGISIIRQGK